MIVSLVNLIKSSIENPLSNLKQSVLVTSSYGLNFSPSRHSSSAVHKNEAQKVKNQHKPNKETRDKQNRFSTTSKPKAKKSNVIGETATVLAGAALAHQMIKHHKHDDARDIADDFRDPYDVDIDDMDD